MQKGALTRFFLLALLPAILLFSSPAKTDTARGIQSKPGRYALVIGNGAYPSSPLKNPANDSSDIARLLETLDFVVVHYQNVGLRDMEKAVRNFGQMLKTGGTGVFYYAGHGMQVEGRNYLIPVDARIESQSDVRFEALDVGRVLGKMEDAGNGLNIVILDACRDNPFARSFRSAQTGLARIDAPRGTLIAYATAPGSVAADGADGERNGVYTKHLLRHLATPGLPTEQAFKNVRIGVIRDTGSKQVPWESSSLTGNFHFASVEVANAPRPEAQPPVSAPKDDSHADYEALYWESIKDSNNPELFRSYLKKYPHGVFVDIAEIRLQGLPKSETASAPREVPVTVAAVMSKPQIHLRSAPGKVTQNELGFILKKFDFFEKSRNRTGNFKGQLVEVGGGIAQDKKTGLMWEIGKSGSKMTHSRAKHYVKELNAQKFGGYDDWRLPTVEEMMSLLTPDQNDGAYIDSIFKDSDTAFWTADLTDGVYRKARLVISFYSGGILLSEGNPYDNYAALDKHTDNFVRAVRTAVP